MSDQISKRTFQLTIDEKNREIESLRKLLNEFQAYHDEARDLRIEVDRLRGQLDHRDMVIARRRGQLQRASALIISLIRRQIGV